MLPALLAMLLIGPVEELGWRGVALPLMQRRLAPLWSSLIVVALVNRKALLDRGSAAIDITLPSTTKVPDQARTPRSRAGERMPRHPLAGNVNATSAEPSLP